MAGARVKIWIDDEVLSASDLNAEFTNILTTSDQLIGNPRTTALDMDRYELTLDQDGDTGIISDTDDRIDLKLSGSDLFRFDGTVTTPVQGLDFVAGDTGTDVSVQAAGSAADTNVSIDIVPLGTGDLKADGVAVNFLTYQVF